MFSQNTIGLPLIINYSKSDFNGGSQTWAIKQDSRGIMYFANDEGLISYNGKYWKTYTLPNKTIVRSIYIDDKDKIYVGGQDEIGFFAPGKQGALTYTSLKDRIPKQYRSFSDVWNIIEYEKAIFFCIGDRIFELSNNNIQVYPARGYWSYINKTGEYLLAHDRNRALLQFKNGKWLPVCTTLPDKNLSSVFSIGKDSFLITDRYGSAYILHNGQLTSYMLNGSIDIRSAIAINESEFVFATSNKGCFSFNMKKGVLQTISYLEGLKNNAVSCIYADKDNNLWVGVNDGISFIAYNSPIKYIRPYAGSELKGYATYIFNNQLYIGTSNGVYTAPVDNVNSDISYHKKSFSAVQNSGDGETWHFDEINQQLCMAHTQASYVIKDDKLSLISKKDSGIWTFLPLSSVYPVQNVLLGTFWGLRMAHFNQNTFTDGGVLSGPVDSYRFLVLDNNNNDIWSSHPYRGIYRIRLSNDKKSYSTQLFTDKDGLPSSYENYVFKIKNRVVFATEKGIYEFDETSNRFIPSEFFRPVFDSLEIHYLSEDSEGNVWFCSGKQIGVAGFTNNPAVNKKSFTLQYFPELTGQASTGFENIYPFNRQNIFIGSENGIIHLNYEKYLATSHKLNVVISNVKAIKDKSDSLLFSGYLLPGQPKNSMIASAYNGFHFEYSAPAFDNQNNIEYRYQLTGYDADWSAWTKRTEKDYTNLPHGAYTFKVQARGNNSESAVVTYSFIILPPWYYTWWAKIGYILAACFVLYVLYLWQQKRMEKQQKKFEAEQNRLKYIHQLELEKNEKEIIKLQNEKLAAEVLVKKKELANTSMQLAENIDALSQIKAEVSRFSTEDNSQELKKIAVLLKDAEKKNLHWDQFAAHFDELNDGFLNKLKTAYPQLSNTDLKICAFLRLNLSSKEIAQLANISVRGVEISRYRLRKKLQLETEQSLNSFLNGIK